MFVDYQERHHYTVNFTPPLNDHMMLAKHNLLDEEQRRRTTSLLPLPDRKKERAKEEEKEGVRCFEERNRARTYNRSL